MNPGNAPFRFFTVLALSAVVSAAKTTPVQIEQTAEAQFPAELAFTTISTGEARAIISIDAEGHLTDLFVTGYTHPAFARETTRLLKQWRYTSATVDGTSVATRKEIKIEFVARGRVVSMQAIDTIDVLRRQMFPAEFQNTLCAPRELDQPVTVLQRVMPAHPGLAPTAAQNEGTTIIEFVLDEAGQIRMPVVLEATNQKYAVAAIDALSQWRFSAPLKQGKPVAVRIQQRFIFPASS